MRGEEDPQQLYLDICREVFPNFRDVMAESLSLLDSKIIFHETAAVPVRDHYRDLFLRETAQNSSAGSIERGARKVRNRARQRLLVVARETQGKKPESVSQLLKHERERLGRTSRTAYLQISKCVR